ncbi:dihydropteroate synthase [Haloplanus salilacus]|uniref:dihydropteroate synthase n=1 Tax=Haloplanus salilacus TaxID=2949994 RepID=UPI0030D4F9A5
MDYHAAADFLSDLRRFAVEPGTESVRDLLTRLDDPQAGVTFVQVAGSNGKGSTARMTESILREAGYRVGLYTSPHFDDVRERIGVDGRKIPESAVVEFVDQVRPFLVDRAVEGEPLTSFETLTAMALWHFGRSDVDVAVLEVGMGGRLDATSVVDPVAAAVTAVSLEHTEVLGESIDDIAAEQVTVAPDDAPLVTGSAGEARDAVRRHAPDTVAVGTAAESPDVTVRYDGLVNHTEAAVGIAGDDWGIETRVPMPGSYQARNAGVAAALARQVGDVVEGSVTEAHLARGIRSAHWPGRFEVMEREPLVVLDGAHNPGACAAVAETLGEYDYDDLHLVFGSMHDKDHQWMVDELPSPSSVWACAPAHERAADPAVLATAFEAGGTADATAAPTVSAALSRAREAAAPDDCILVVGSLFAVGEARRTWSRLAVPREVDTVDDARTTLDRSNSDADATVAEDSVHRVATVRLDRREARAIDRAAGRAGATAVTADYRTGRELRPAVLSGTRTELRSLLAAVGDEYGGVADRLREAVGLGADTPTHGYPWEERPSVMGILNVTPDSFHDGGDYFDPTAAVDRAEAMVEAGADVIDVGGESTRPGADPVSAAEEIERVRPVIDALSDLDALVSIDTRKAEVARAALDAGADVLNDVTGLADPEMRFLAAEYDVPVVVMHSIDAPVVPDKTVAYDDVVSDVIDELAERVALAERAGLDREKVIVDPGLGFGKEPVEEFELLDRLGEFRALGCPVLVGHSHKSMFGYLGQGADERLPATVATTALAVDRGADLVRVHDVPENVAAVRAAVATADAESTPEDWRA